MTATSTLYLRSILFMLVGLVAAVPSAPAASPQTSSLASAGGSRVVASGTNVLACWDFSTRVPDATLPAGERVEDSCGDHDSRVLDSLDVVVGIGSADGALDFSADNSDALLFEPGYDFGDGGPVAGTEFDFETGDGITLEALIRVPPSFTGVGSIVSKDVGSGQASWWFRISNGTLQGFVGDGTVQQAVTGVREVNDGQWHHVALVREPGDSLSLYVDYALDASVAIPVQDDIATPQGTPVRIGGFNNGARELDGSIQMVRIVREALTPQDFLLADEVSILNVDMDHDGEPLVAGAATQYDISVSNTGPVSASDVTIEAPMPSGFAGLNWTCVGDGGASCTASGTGDLIDSPDLPSGGSVTYTVDADLDSNLPALVTYTATIDPGEQVAFGNTSASVTTLRVGVERLHVDQSASPAGDGASWASAFDNLQDALNVARDLTEVAGLAEVSIWVAAGVYHPDHGAAETAGDRDAAFLLGNGIAIYGGFAGTETEFSERDWVANPTVLSGDIDHNDTVDASGATGHFSDIVGNNSYHVVRATEVNASAVLDGFVITGGLANGNADNPIDGIFERRHGGGLNFHRSHPELNNLVVQGNRAHPGDGHGGGIYLRRQTGVLPFMNLTGIVLQGNAAYRGGGLYAWTQDYRLRDCIVENNSATRSGGIGGLSARFEIRDCRISGNQASLDWGGGLGATSSRGAIVNALFAGNHSGGNGGGLWIGPDTTQFNVLLTNVTFSANHADGVGGGIYHNQADIGTTTMYNSIVWNNSDSSGTGTPGSSHGGPGAARLEAAHSLLQGLDPAGSGNLDGTDPANDPLFISPLEPSDAPQLGGNYRVGTTSPTIDQGDNQARISRIEGTNPYVPLEGNVLSDLDGLERIVDGNGDTTPRVDLGPYESPGATGRLIGGEVNGLAGTGLILQNNGTDDLAIAENGSFVFSTPVGDGRDYQVTVFEQPSGPFQTCTVSNGSGTVSGEDVTDIVIDCVNDAVFAIGGSVSGLTGSGLVLQNNSGDDLPISADGPFSFGQALPSGSSYEVSVLSQPDYPAQTCTISNGSGVVNGEDVDNIQVQCEDLTFTPIACWDFSTLTPATSLADGQRVEDTCNDHDARVVDGLDVIEGFNPGAGAIAFSSGNADALVFAPEFDFGDGGPVAGSEFDFAGDQNFTLEAIVRVPQGYTGAGGIISKDVGPGQASWWFRINGGVLQALISDGSEQSISGTRPINDGGWHHVALVRDAGNGSLALYVDYQLDAQISTSPMADLATPAGTPIVLGAFNAGNRQLEGDMQVARITDLALPVSQFLLNDEVAALDIAIDHDGEALTPGETTQYLITVGNAGPSARNAVSVEAPMPEGFAAASWSCVAEDGASCAASGTGDLSDTIDLPVDSHVTYTVTVDLEQSLPPLLTYTGTIDPGAELAIGTLEASVATPIAGLGRLYVRPSAPAGGYGLSWDTAFDSLQDALSTARSLTEYADISIWVAEGVHYPDEGSGHSPGDREAAFMLTNNVALYGGFAGHETELSERDWLAHPTVLSGDIDANDSGDEAGIVTHYSQIAGSNSFHVVRAFEVNDSAVLDGFMITGGNASGTGPGNPIDGVFDRRDGAGVHVRQAHPTLSNLVIQGNRANLDHGQGGGISLFSESGAGLPTLEMQGIVLRGNGALAGGGLSAARQRFRIEDCRIEDNDAGGGAGVYVWLMLFEMEGCRVAGNHATRADFGGGGLYSFRGRAAIVNTVFSGNRAQGEGGGLWIDPNTLAFDYVLTNVTLAGNHAAGLGGAIYHARADWGANRVNNAIIWNNSDSTGVGTPSASHGGPGAGRIIATHSLVQGLNPAADGNLDGTDPGNAPPFFDPRPSQEAPTSSGSLRVALDSPTIDQGDNQARITPIVGSSIPNLPVEGNLPFDLDGRERIIDALGSGTATVDLGPWEHPGLVQHTLGGQVSGLNGTGLVLRNNGGDELPILSNGAFEFDQPLEEGQSYDVTVFAMPGDPLQYCTISNGQGLMEYSDVHDILVECVDRGDLIFSDRYEN